MIHEKPAHQIAIVAQPAGIVRGGGEEQAGSLYSSRGHHDGTGPDGESRARQAGHLHGGATFLASVISVAFAFR